jgi:hypothetical protein
VVNQSSSESDEELLDEFELEFDEELLDEFELEFDEELLDEFELEFDEELLDEFELEFDEELLDEFELPIIHQGKFFLPPFFDLMMNWTTSGASAVRSVVAGSLGAAVPAWQIIGTAIAAKAATRVLNGFITVSELRFVLPLSALRQRSGPDPIPSV